MNTVTLSLEDYNELKAKADKWDSMQPMRDVELVLFGSRDNISEQRAKNSF